MEIADEKQKFLNLLRTSYSAELPNKGKGGVFAVDPCRVYLSGDILEQFGFDYHDSSGLFWRVICPSLKAEGYLTEYEPASMNSESWYLRNYVPEHQDLIQRRDSIAAKLPREYWSMANNVASGGQYFPQTHRFSWDSSVQAIFDEIKSITVRLDALRAEHRGKPSHLFVVNEDKLLNVKSDKNTVSFDGGRIVSFKDKRHTFHDDKGKKGLPLRFFKMLWEKRTEIKGGKTIRTGERRDEYLYARELSVADDSYAYKKSVEYGESEVGNLIKGLNRSFRAKKIPAVVSTRGGVQLEITNP